MINNTIFKAPVTRWCFTTLKVNPLLLCILLVCVAGLSACSEKVEFELKDSGMSASVGSINWLDNERVIFVHFEGKKGKVYIWNIVTEETKKYSDEVDSNICYSDGYIYYRSRVEGDSIYYKKGMFPDEKEFLVTNNMQNEVYDKYSCVWRKKSPEQKNEFIHYLKEEHGYIHLGSKVGKRFEYPIYVQSDGKKSTIKFRYQWYYNRPQAFYPFKGAYFIFKPFLPVWDGSGCNPGIWVYPTGVIKGECIPFIEAVRNYGSAYPVRDGYLIISLQTGKYNNDAGKSGIYYVENSHKEVSLLLAGLSSGFSISPDGCKAAFFHNPVVTNKNTLKIINLCKSGDL